MKNYDLMIYDILDFQGIAALCRKRYQESVAAKKVNTDLLAMAEDEEREARELCAAMAADIIKDTGAGDPETLSADIFRDPKRFIKKEEDKMQNYDSLLCNLLEAKDISGKLQVKYWESVKNHAADNSLEMASTKAEAEAYSIAKSIARDIIKNTGTGDLDALAAEIFTEPKKFMTTYMKEEQPMTTTERTEIERTIRELSTADLRKLKVFLEELKAEKK